MGNSMKNMKMSRKITMIDGIHGSFRAFFWDFLGTGEEERQAEVNKVSGGFP